MKLYPYQLAFLRDTSPFRIYNKSRQIGITFLSALEAVKTAGAGISDVLYASASIRQSREVKRKAARFVEAFNESDVLGFSLPLSTNTKDEIGFENGRKIHFLPSNPATVRGFSGDVYLDEFALHKNQKEIFKALLPTVTRGYKLTVVSTPLGKSDLFYKLFTDTRRYPDFSRHQTTIVDAVAQGLDVNLDMLKRNTDEETFRQEYMCEFIDESTSYFPYELINSCIGETKERKGEVFLGADIGRKHDLTALFFFCKFEGAFYFLHGETMKNTDFQTQKSRILHLVKEMGVRRGCIDATGIGSQLAEELHREAGIIEPVSFTPKLKEEMVIRCKRLFEEKRIEIPPDRQLIGEIHSIQRKITTSGNIRFDSDREETEGHADRFWALALALHAGLEASSGIAYEAVKKRDFFFGSDDD